MLSEHQNKPGALDFFIQIFVGVPILYYTKIVVGSVYVIFFLEIDSEPGQINLPFWITLGGAHV